MGNLTHSLDAVGVVNGEFGIVRCLQLLVLHKIS